MSVKAMSRAWELDLPHAERLVLLAMADHADHEGRNIYPSIALIVWKTGYSESQVHRSIRALVDAGILVLEAAGGGRGATNIYMIELDAGTLKPPFNRGGDSHTRAMTPQQKGARVAPFPREKGVTLAPFPAKRVSSTTEKGAKNGRKGAIAMAPDPLTVKEPPLTEEEGDEIDWDMLERLGLGGRP